MMAVTEKKSEKQKHRTMVVAIILMSVSTLQAMAATLSKRNGEYPYKVIGATLLSEVFKLVTSLTMLAVQGGNLYWTRRSLMMAAVPGFAYQILNNLNFVTLYYVDAPTFQILGNLKIVATGLAGVCLLGRHLSRGKWLALILLTLGAATSQIQSSCEAVEAPSAGFARFMGYISAVICVFLSASMGVFTEMYMKGNPASIHFQNMQLYFFGITANVLALLYRKEIGPQATTSLLHGFNFWAVVTVITNGSCGLAVSFLLRYADSIAKTYSTSLAIPCTSLAAYFFLQQPITPPNVLGSGVMLISLAYFYFGDQLFPQLTPLSKPSSPPVDPSSTSSNGCSLSSSSSRTPLLPVVAHPLPSSSSSSALSGKGDHPNGSA